LFNSGRFFEAHEALESLWLQVQGEEKLFLHGLIQVAAAFHHYQRDNLHGFALLLQKGSAKLMRFPESRFGLDMQNLLTQLRPWLNAAHASSPPAALALPIIQVSRGLPQSP